MVAMCRSRPASDQAMAGRLLTIVLLVVILCAGCASVSRPVPAQEASLYDQLGGEPVVRQLVKDFTSMMARDARVKEIFAFTDWRAFRPTMHDFLCQVADGGCHYEGSDMRTAHRGVGITHAEFNVSVELMQKAMTKNRIALSAQNQLLARLAGFHGDIVHQ